MIVTCGKCQSTILAVENQIFCIRCKSIKEDSEVLEEDFQELLQLFYSKEKYNSDDIEVMLDTIEYLLVLFYGLEDVATAVVEESLSNRRQIEFFKKHFIKEVPSGKKRGVTA